MTGLIKGWIVTLDLRMTSSFKKQTTFTLYHSYLHNKRYIIIVKHRERLRSTLHLVQLSHATQLSTTTDSHHFYQT